MKGLSIVSASLVLIMASVTESVGDTHLVKRVRNSELARKSPGIRPLTHNVRWFMTSPYCHRPIFNGCGSTGPAQHGPCLSV